MTATQARSKACEIVAVFCDQPEHPGFQWWWERLGDDKQNEIIEELMQVLQEED